MHPPQNDDPVHGWRLETRRDANGDRQHQSAWGWEWWRPVRSLGSGASGDVSLERCLCGPSRDELRAVKQIGKRRAGITDFAKRELEALAAFSDARVPEYRHYFVQFLGWFDDVKHLYIAMEFVQGGDLQRYIYRRPFPEPVAAMIIAQVAQALQYMHWKN